MGVILGLILLGAIVGIGIKWPLQTIAVFVLLVVIGSANAGEDVQVRPDGLKAQISLMKIEAPVRFECMVDELKSDWGNDKSVFLYSLKKNVKAYWDIREADYPADTVAKAFRDFPCDFSTALYVIKKDVASNSELEDLLN